MEHRLASAHDIVEGSRPPPRLPQVCQITARGATHREPTKWGGLGMEAEVASLVALLKAAEDRCAESKEFTKCSELFRAQQQLLERKQAVSRLRAKEEAAVASRDFGQAQEAHKEEVSASASLEEMVQELRRKFEAELNAASTIPVAAPVQMGEAVFHPQPPQQTYPASYPASGIAGLAGAAGLPPLQSALEGPSHVQPIAARAAGTMRQPLLAPSNGINVPAGAPPGGQYKIEKYMGPLSWCICCFACCCIICCPCDEREIYVAPNGRKYTRNGAEVGDC